MKSKWSWVRMKEESNNLTSSLEREYLNSIIMNDIQTELNINSENDFILDIFRYMNEME